MLLARVAGADPGWRASARVERVDVHSGFGGAQCRFRELAHAAGIGERLLRADGAVLVKQGGHSSWIRVPDRSHDAPWS